MIQEPFAHGNSPIHRMDARAKIILAAVATSVVAVLSAPAALIAALLTGVLLAVAARLQLAGLLKGFIALNTFMLFIWVVVPLTFTGDPLYQWGPLTVTGAGVELATRITLKANAIFLIFTALIATSPVAVLGHALDRLRAPDKIVLLLLLTYRYVFVIEQEYSRLSRAAAIRGFRPGTNLHTYKTYAYMVGMLLVRASVRAERVKRAMLCRGFQGRFLSLHEFSFARRDWVWSIIIIFATATTAALEWAVPFLS